MLSVADVLAFAGTALVLIVLPGPSTLFTVGRAISAGRRDALLTVVGNAVGEYALVAAIAFGLSSLLTRSLTAFTIMKWVGAGYLIFLGVQAFRRRRSLTDALATRARPRAVTAALGNGFVVGVANPKSAIFFAAILPQFIDRSVGHIAGQFLLLGAIYGVIAVCCDGVLAFGASAARAWFARSPRRLAAIGGAGGLAMIGLGIGLAFSGRND